ncbi:MAG: xylulose kinase [Candidatus Omnitrophica bacterium]|nr:xylulose kinase [Candidatus Omnitrophota bacterium]
MAKFFAAIDCGTSAIKAAIFSENGKSKSIVFDFYYPYLKSQSKVEQNPQLLIKKIYSCLKKAVEKANIKPNSVLSLSLSTQRATFLAVDKRGKPLTNIISWQDQRGKEMMIGFAKKISDKSYYQITGLPSNPIFSLAKILWIQKNANQIYKKIDKFTLLHSYILKELGCKDYLEDHSNASLSGLLDIRKLTWSKQLLKTINLDENKLADLVPSGKVVGYLSKRAAKKTGLVEGLPLVSGGGDQQCAALGAGAIKPGVLEVTLGTAGVPLIYSKQPVFDPKLRIMCCAHVLEGCWELEGFQGCVGASIQWFNNLIGGKKFAKAIFKKVEKSGAGANGILFYPYLTGASCPNWNPNAKGVFLGLSLGSKKVDLLRAIIEGISFETKETIDLFSHLGIKIKEVRLTGGYSKNNVWNQIQADIYQRRLITLGNHQATLAGGAALAAYGIGVDKDLKQTALRFSKIKRIFYPDKKKKLTYNKIYKKYRKIYKIFDKNKIF